MITPTLTIGSARSEVHSVHKSVCTTTLRWAILQPSEGVHTIHNMHAHQHQQVSSPSHHKSHPSGSRVATYYFNNNNSQQQQQHYCSQPTTLSGAGSLRHSCCPAQVLLHCHLAPRTHKRVAGACRLALPQPSKHALHLNITRPVMRSTKLLVKSAAAADTKLPGWHGQVLLVHSPATCRATTTHC